MENTICVTRHKALVEYLKEKKLIDDTVPIIDHVDDPSVIEGRDVVGVLPLSLACLARTVTEIPLDMSRVQRGRELSIEDMRELAGEPATYTVKKIRLDD